MVLNNRKQLLVVEDDQSIARVIEIFLSQKGFDVKAVDSSEEAINCAKDTTYDFFMVDLVLTGENGFEFVRKLRKLPQYFRTPVVIMTARLAADDEDVVSAAGADGLIIKPFDLENMASIVEDLYLERMT